MPAPLDVTLAFVVCLVLLVGSWRNEDNHK